MTYIGRPISLPSPRNLSVYYADNVELLRATHSVMRSSITPPIVRNIVIIITGIIPAWTIQSNLIKLLFRNPINTTLLALLTFDQSRNT